LVAVLADYGHLNRARQHMTRLTAMIPERDRAMLHMLEARFAVAQGNPVDSCRAYMDALTERGFPDDPNIPPWHGVIYRAATSALASGDAEAADSLARHAIRLEGELGQDESRSGDIGLALLLLSRARLAVGDSVGSREALLRAVAPHESGLGPSHTGTREARRLLAGGVH